VKNTRDALGIAFALLAAAFIVNHCVGCQKFNEQAAEEAFKKERLDCVEKYHLEVDIRKCDNDVKRKWGVAETVTVKRLDGGAP